jgi:hypothetical protein
MRKSTHSALERYMARRGGKPLARAMARPPLSVRRLFRVAALATLLAAACVFAMRPRPVQPIKVTYEVDLSRAARGELVITMVCDGRLPGKLDLVLPPGTFGDSRSGVHARDPKAHALGADGRQLRPLKVIETADGWNLRAGGSRRTGIVYSLDLRAAPGSEQDVRRHISTPVAGGLRAAGFEIFLEPLGVPVEGLTVVVRNPDDIPVLVPWPAVVRNDLQQAREDTDADAAQHITDASLGYGQGFQPAAQAGTPAELGRSAAAAPVPANLFYHPRDIADLNNALLVCGDIRTHTAQAGDCVIQLATDRDWMFTDEAALDLVRRIARTEMGFFGSAPTDQITVLLSANAITGDDRFDVYGVHTGSSVLVMLDADTTWGAVEDQAASVIAHEMFHGWLGEAVRQTDPTMLWFTEGATTWYAARMLTAAGVWRTEHARGVLGARLDRDYTGNPLRGTMSVADAAAEVMAPAEQVRFGYAGGVTACMALDEMLAEKGGHARPLDGILRHLYAQDRGKPLTRQRLEAAVLQATGVDCAPWLDAHVYGKTALPPIKSML